MILLVCCFNLFVCVLNLWAYKALDILFDDNPKTILEGGVGAAGVTGTLQLPLRLVLDWFGCCDCCCCCCCCCCLHRKIHNYLAGRESARQTADFNTYLLLLLLLYYKIIIESNWCIGGNWEGINFFLEEKYLIVRIPKKNKMVPFNSGKRGTICDKLMLSITCLTFSFILVQIQAFYQYTTSSSTLSWKIRNFVCSILFTMY